MSSLTGYVDSGLKLACTTGDRTLMLSLLPPEQVLVVTQDGRVIVVSSCDYKRRRLFRQTAVSTAVSHFPRAPYTR